MTTRPQRPIIRVSVFTVHCFLAHLCRAHSQLPPLTMLDVEGRKVPVNAVDLLAPNGRSLFYFQVHSNTPYFNNIFFYLVGHCLSTRLSIRLPLDDCQEQEESSKSSVSVVRRIGTFTLNLCKPSPPCSDSLTIHYDRSDGESVPVVSGNPLCYG
jgi:hypothetical protein